MLWVANNTKQGLRRLGSSAIAADVKLREANVVLKAFKQQPAPIVSKAIQSEIHRQQTVIFTQSTG